MRTNKEWVIHCFYYWLLFFMFFAIAKVIKPGIGFWYCWWVGAIYTFIISVICTLTDRRFDKCVHKKQSLDERQKRSDDRR